MTKVEVALVEAPPEAIVGAQVRYLAGVAENEGVLILPVRLAPLGVDAVAIGALHEDFLLIVLLLLPQLLVLAELVTEEADAVVLLPLIIVGHLAVLAVNSGLRTRLKVLKELDLLNLLATLAQCLAIGAVLQVLKSFPVQQQVLVPVFLGFSAIGVL